MGAEREPSGTPGVRLAVALPGAVGEPGAALTPGRAWGPVAEVAEESAAVPSAAVPSAALPSAAQASVAVAESAVAPGERVRPPESTWRVGGAADGGLGAAVAGEGAPPGPGEEAQQPSDRPKAPMLAGAAIAGALLTAVPFLMMGSGSHHTPQVAPTPTVTATDGTVLQGSGGDPTPGSFTSATSSSYVKSVGAASAAASVSPSASSAVSLSQAAGQARSTVTTTRTSAAAQPANAAKSAASTATVSAAGPIYGTSYAAQSGVSTETTSDSGGGRDLAQLADGAWARYDNVDFGSTPLTQFKARVASGAGSGISGLVEVRLDSLTASPVGTFSIANTGGWQSWRLVPANMSSVTGVHTVYLTFNSGQGAPFTSLNWFRFTAT